MHSAFLPGIEKQPQSKIRDFQNAKLSELIHYLATFSPFYREIFRRENIAPGSIKSIEDLARIPVTVKEDLQQSPSGFLCVGPEKIIDYTTTSGTLGDPVTFALTDGDLDRLAYNEAISFACADHAQEDIYQLMTTIDRRFMAGLAYFLGIRKLGAGVVRVGNGIPELQWDTILRIKPTTIVAVPSFILRIIDFAEQRGIDYRNSSIKKAVCIGEPLRNTDFSLNTLGRRITEKWPLKLYSTYASTEMATSFTECGFGMGGHHHPELIIIEFLDENDNPVNPGQMGEVTITTLGIQAMPLLRFKTGDICAHFTDPCACGRTTTRLGPVVGRKNQMIKFKGTTIYPPALYDILDNIDQVSGYIVEVSTNEIGTDDISIMVCGKGDSDLNIKEIKDHFRAKLRVAPELKILPKNEIMRMQFPEMSRKPVKFIDLREKA